jgi:hypothetical protein
MGQVAQASLHDTGQWAEYSPAWAAPGSNFYPIHMLLARGEGSPYHSQILWYSGEANNTTFFGHETAWKPASNECEDFPDSNFSQITVAPSGLDAFCSAANGLADGSVLICGGTDPVNTVAGERGARVWRPGTTQSSGNWTNANQMSEHRWYPTSCVLGTGEVAIFSGLQNWCQASFGGRVDSVLPTGSAGDSVRIFEPLPGGQWKTSVIPQRATGTGPAKPYSREFHTGVGMESYLYDPFNAEVYFGGKDSTGHALDDTWLLRRDQNITGADYTYKWIRGPQTGKPAQRSEHSAIASRGDNPSMYIFGGLGDDSTALGDIHRLYYDIHNDLTWRQVTNVTGTAPTARYGHTAFYDEIPGPGDTTTIRRMILFGGSASPDSTPTDNNVYEMRIGAPDSVAWSVMSTSDLGFDPPTARLGHAMDVDLSWTNRVYAGNGKHGHAAFMFGGQTGASSYSNELWILWVFNDGTVGWQKLNPSGDVPSARTHASLICDTRQGKHDIGSAEGRLHIFGGQNGPNPGSVIDKDQYVVDPWFVSPVFHKWAAYGGKVSGHVTVLQPDQVPTARVAEVYKPSNNTWTTHTGTYLFQFGYPPTFLISGGSTAAGRVFSMDAYGSAYHLDVPANGDSVPWIPYTHGSLGFYAEAMAMYRPGKILAACGFATSNKDSAWIGRTRTFNIAQPESSWKDAAYGSGNGSLTPRRFHNLVILPNGKVLAVGGLNCFDSDDSTTATKYPQIWDPDTKAWTGATELAEQLHPRNYHSVAMLLPDGRILSSGGSNENFAHGHLYYFEQYCPPYLFKNDTLATRPTLIAATSRWRYNQSVTFAVGSGNTIKDACLIRAPATTHAFDQSQRYVPLALTSSAVRYDGKRQYFLTAPADSFIAPPGDYLLFANDSSGVPAIAQWVRVGSAESGQFDATAPDSFRINIAFVGCTSIGIDWEAPGNNGNTGTALDYDLRYSTSPITSGNISSATPVSGLGIPQLAGSAQSASASGLSGCTWYHFGGNSRDGAGNWSLVSTARAKTPCGYCFDDGESMHRSRDESSNAETPTREASSGLKSFVVPNALIGGDGTLRLVAEFEKDSTSNWRLAYQSLAADSALLSSSAARVVVQDPVSGGWATRSTFTPGGGHLAVRSLVRSGRIVFPAGATLMAAESAPLGFHCNRAVHSRLGDLLAVGASIDSVSIDAAQGDTLELAYSADSTSASGEDCFFHVLIPGGAQASHSRPQGRPALASDLPVEFAFHPSRPNPFQHSTVLRFDLPRASALKLEVFDIQGRRIATLANETRAAGRHSLVWDGHTDGGEHARAGLYLCRMTAGSFVAERRLTLLP